MSVCAWRSDSGFTLPEMLCALLLGSALLLGVALWLAQLREAALMQSQRMRMQLQAQHAAALLRQDMHAFAGPAQPAAPPPFSLSGDLACDQEWLFGFDPPLVRWRFAAGDPLPPCLRTEAIVPDSDVALLRLLGAPIARADAEPGRIYVWQDVDGQTQWVEGSQSASVGAAVIWPLHLTQWYLRRYAVDPGDGLPTLCRRRPTRQVVPPRMGASECLVEGVENLRLQLFEAPSQDVESSRAMRPDFAVKLALLLRSPLPVPGVGTAQRYRLLDEDSDTLDDGHLRSVLHQTRPLHRWMEVPRQDD